MSSLSPLQLIPMTRSIIRICQWDALLAYLDHDWVKWLAISMYKFPCEEFSFIFLMKKTNYTLNGLIACLILYTRSAGVVYFAMGAVFCGITVKVVKGIIRQPRPLQKINIPGRKTKTSYGCVEARVFL